MFLFVVNNLKTDFIYCLNILGILLCILSINLNLPDMFSVCLSNTIFVHKMTAITLSAPLVHNTKESELNRSHDTLLALGSVVLILLHVALSYIYFLSCPDLTSE